MQFLLIASCYARDYFGGIGVNANNQNLKFFHITIDKCKSVRSTGGFGMINNNNNIDINNINITDCIAEKLGAGGFSLFLNNYNIIIKTLNIRNCRSYNYGGGMFIGINNYDILFNDIAIINCTTFINGGGIYIKEYNKNLIFKNVGIKFNYCHNNGGGMYIGNFNTFLSFISIELSYNEAKNCGGGIYINELNFRIFLVNLNVISNYALNDGGGLYFSVGCNMIYIISEKNYNQMQIIEYSTKQYIIDTIEDGYESNDDDDDNDINDYGHFMFKYTSYVNDSVGYILNFDPSSVIGSDLTLLIKASKTKILFKSNYQTTFLPGIDLPSLRIDGNHFTVYLYTKSPNSIFRFKIYAIPAFINSEKNIFRDNKVNGNGGAIYFDSYILNSYITSTKFLNNYAYNEGGAISISYANWNNYNYM
jgi:predicted outer membrane repeat protein